MTATRIVGICFLVSCALPGPPALFGASLESWQEALLEDLGRRYLDETFRPETWLSQLDQVSRAIGDLLAEGGLKAVPSEDVAALALLQSRLTATPPAESAPPPAPTSPQQEQAFEDISKGQEGLRQGIDRLSELPLSERMVVTGDVNAGIQGILVPNSSDMSSAFGRFRLNVVARAMPASPSGRVGEGYFFLQLRAAGGPFDSTPVGHPPAFSPFNDIATDRSLVNESLDRGNLYLGKAYYQQQLYLGSKLEDSLLTQVGIVDFSDFFDTNRFANNEVRQFLNTAFVNAAAYKTAIGAPGVAGEYSRDLNKDRWKSLKLRGGLAVSRIDKAFSSPLWNGEAELGTLLKGRDGSWRIGGSVGNVADRGGVRTLYLSVDQWVSQSVGIFGRFVVNNSGPGSLVFGQARQSLSGGFQRRFVSEDDLVSAWGLGFSQAWGIELDRSLVPERVFETYYRWQITRGFAITPDFQLVSGAGGAPGTHWILGLRTNFGF